MSKEFVQAFLINFGIAIGVFMMIFGLFPLITYLGLIWGWAIYIILVCILIALAVTYIEGVD